MVSIRTGGGVTGMSGSIAGDTFSRNKSGSYMRTRTVPTNVRSSSQSVSRALFSQLSQHWKDVLSASQRSSWNTYADSVSSLNKLGERIHLTGQLHFIRTNQGRLTAGLSLVSSAPSILLVSERDPVFTIAGETPPVLAVSFDDTLAWCSENGAALAVFVSCGKHSTRNFFNGPWKYAGSVLGSAASPARSPAVIPLPASIAIGQRLFAKAHILRVDGRCSSHCSSVSKIFSVMSRMLTSNSGADDNIYLRNLSGDLLGSFTCGTLWRGIHQDPCDNTLWCVVPTNDHIINFTLSGSAASIICEGHTAEAIKGLDGCAIDTRDGSLWAPGDVGAVESLTHYSRHVDVNNHHTLIATFNTSGFISTAKDICWDSTDNTIWLADSIAKKVVHVSPSTGLELPGSLDLVALGFPVGITPYAIEFFHASNSFYIGDNNAGIYHCTKAGVILEHIVLPDHIVNLNTVTFGPLSISI